MKQKALILACIVLTLTIVVWQIMCREEVPATLRKESVARPQMKADEADANVLFLIDFTRKPDGSAVEWLKNNGFEFKLDFEKLNPSFRHDSLHLSTERPLAGVCGFTMDTGKEITGAKKARITWGLERHPEGADWESGVNRMAIGVMISFGQQRLPSGLPLGVMNAPYFICPFLCKEEPEGKLYIGQYWKEGGRYLSVKPNLGSLLTITEIDLPEQFSKAFPRKDIPAISAVGFQMNTKDTKGIASAFIKKIEFLKN